MIGFSKGGDRKSDEFQSATVALRTTKEIAQEIGISEKSMKNRLYAERSEIPISFAISGVVFNSATVAELGYLKGGDRKSDKFQKATVALRSTKEIAHDIDRG